MPGPIIPWGGAAAAPSAPAGSLIARYDASDTANHNVGSGLVSPSAGTATIDLQFETSGTPGAFTYGTTQNGRRTISCPATGAFAPVSNSAGTVTELLMVFAYRLNTFAQGFINRFEKASDGSQAGLYFDTTGQTQIVSETIGASTTLALTGINTGDGAFKIIGMIYDASTLGFLQSDQVGDALTMGSMASYSSALYPHHTDNAVALSGDLDFCELLLYNSASPGTLAAAIHYLAAKWDA